MINLPNVPARPRQDVDLIIDKFNAGVISLLDEARLPAPAARQATNLIQVQDGLWKPRWGTKSYTVAGNANVSGAAEYVKSDGTTELIEVIGTSAYKSTNGGTKTALTGASFTSGTQCFFLQIRSRLYISNGTDNLCYYDGSVLQTFSSLATPTGLAAALTNLTTGNYTIYYQVTAVNAVGYTAACAEVSQSVVRTRDNWSGTDKVSLSWNAVAGATSYEIYYSAVSGQEVYLDSVNSTHYDDDGSVAANSYKEAPVDNTTTGPKFKKMELSGNRIWATGDPGNKWRIYWSGTGQNTGVFSPFYGGGYVDLEKGGRETPQGVIHYRDGKGTSYATILTTDPEGNGSIWQISLDSVTVGSSTSPTTFTVPGTTKVVGSIGASGPLAMVKVKNDIMYANNKGVYATGSRPQLLNVLSTDESSANIRPAWRNLTASATSKIAMYYYDAKVFVAVPDGSSTNNEVWIYDTERRNWAYAWTGVAIMSFLEYADSSGGTHFLAVPAAGTQLIEFSSNYQGDNGTAFATSYLSGIYPVHKDHTKFAKIRYCYIELARPTGSITFQVSGTTKKNGFSTLNSITITSTTANAGWSTQLWSNNKWSNTDLAPVTFAQATVKKRLRINKLLNNLQFQVTSNSVTTDFTLMGLQAKGEIIPTSDPLSWRS
jgi:hypothetical protein